MDESAGLLALVLGESTMVPRKINGIEIEESDDLQYRNAEKISAWQANLSNIMGHFSTVGNFLGIVSIVLAQNGKERSDKNADAEKSEDENGKRTDNDSTSIATPPLSSSEHIIRLDKFRHLSLFADSNGLVRSHLVPLLAKGTFMGLKTLVAECHDRDALVKWIGAAAPVLHSLVIAFNVPDTPGAAFFALSTTPQIRKRLNVIFFLTGIDIDVSKVTSLRNLGVSIAHYPESKHALADTVATVLSAPPSLEHIFLNIGATAIESEKQLDSESLQWAALNVVLARLPQLRRITIIIVFDSCIRTFVGMKGGGGGFVEKWENDALTYIKTRLPGYHAKGLLEVKSVFDSWTSGALADYPLLE
ncbi:hypothetical protein ColLi_11146 [Colletotrichum liriopes]|uniref:Uncharacterized protein n=1 Tax=Colletotrichum liriopes TaxID=708192 RepID=A0AA37GVX8_9PEZI|nr:hypothetical protein ColLi_11146 [Colletotrichum liriopes]